MAQSTFDFDLFWRYPDLAVLLLMDNCKLCGHVHKEWMKLATGPDEVPRLVINCSE